MKSTALSIALVIPICSFASSVTDTNNPYMKMIDKPYASYAMEIKDLRWKMDYVLSREQADTLCMYMKEAADAAGNHRWEFENRFHTMAYQLHYEDNYTPENVKQDLKAICKENDTIIYLQSSQSPLTPQPRTYSMCKYCIDLAKEYNHQLGPYLSPVNLYPILCKYYLRIGNTTLGQRYMDSVIVTQKRTTEKFDMMKLVRVEQRNHKFEHQIKADELRMEQQRVEKYRNLAILTSPAR